MSLLKVCTIILCYFLGRMAIAAPCEQMKSLSENYSVCWDDELKASLLEKCTKKNAKCDAVKFLTKKQNKIGLSIITEGQNLAAMYCHELKHKVEILRDKDGNEQSYCVFKDGSMVDVNAIERHVQ